MRLAAMTFLSKLGRGRSAWNDFFNDESGQDLIEYALVAALVALGSVAAMKTLATNIGTAYNGVGSTLTSAV
jgi:pilus assembly protein Flp/PilA